MALVPEEEDVLLSARLSRTLAEYKLGSLDMIDRPSFELVCVAYPSIVLRFYQTWTAICEPHTLALPSRNRASQLPNCVAQPLSFLNPAEFDRSLPVSRNEDERQLQLDLQNAPLVAELSSSAGLDGQLLVGKLSNDDWFHVMLVSAEETSGSAFDTGNSGQLFVLFTSPCEGQIPYWDCPGGPTYVRRYGIVQVLPHFTVADWRPWC